MEGIILIRTSAELLLFDISDTPEVQDASESCLWERETESPENRTEGLWKMVVGVRGGYGSESRRSSDEGSFRVYVLYCIENKAKQS